MMENEFIPYEEALALKELGFDEECLKSYHIVEKIRGQEYIELKEVIYDNIIELCHAPLYQQAFRWFREEHGIDALIEPRWKHPDADKKYCVEIIDPDDKSDFRTDDDIHHTDFETHEEAEFACLNKLIEIVNQTKDE